jgi:hypothetical protein
MAPPTARLPRSAEATEQIDALDRLARQERGESGSLLQFVERCSLITYASSARLERVQQEGLAARAEYPEFYGLARRLRLIAQLVKAGLATPIYTRTSRASTRTAASSSSTRTCCASWGRR